MGGCLHVCYAPEYESVSDTKEKIDYRIYSISKRIGQLKSASHENQTSANASEDSASKTNTHGPNQTLNSMPNLISSNDTKNKTKVARTATCLTKDENIVATFMEKPSYSSRKSKPSLGGYSNAASFACSDDSRHPAFADNAGTNKRCIPDACNSINGDTFAKNTFANSDGSLAGAMSTGAHDGSSWSHYYTPDSDNSIINTRDCLLSGHDAYSAYDGRGQYAADCYGNREEFVGGGGDNYKNYSYGHLDYSLDRISKGNRDGCFNNVVASPFFNCPNSAVFKSDRSLPSPSIFDAEFGSNKTPCIRVDNSLKHKNLPSNINTENAPCNYTNDNYSFKNANAYLAASFVDDASANRSLNEVQTLHFDIPPPSLGSPFNYFARDACNYASMDPARLGGSWTRNSTTNCEQGKESDTGRDLKLSQVKSQFKEVESGWKSTTTATNIRSQITKVKDDNQSRVDCGVNGLLRTKDVIIRPPPTFKSALRLVPRQIKKVGRPIVSIACDELSKEGMLLSTKMCGPTLPPTPTNLDSNSSEVDRIICNNKQTMQVTEDRKHSSFDETIVDIRSKMMKYDNPA